MEWHTYIKTYVWPRTYTVKVWIILGRDCHGLGTPLYILAVGMPTMQGPNPSSPTPFFSIVFAVSNMEGCGNVSFLDKEQAYLLLVIKETDSLNLVFLGCDRNLCMLVFTWAPPHSLPPGGVWGVKENQYRHDAYAACCAMSNKGLCL